MIIEEEIFGDVSLTLQIDLTDEEFENFKRAWFEQYVGAPSKAMQKNWTGEFPWVSKVS
jgi:hypothetical protein